MRIVPLLLAACLMVASGCASMGSSSDAVVKAALANPARSDADRERAARDRSAELLKLAGFRCGMTVADIFGGGGCYSEIIAGIVGPGGEVPEINNAPDVLPRPVRQ